MTGRWARATAVSRVLALALAFAAAGAVAAQRVAPLAEVSLGFRGAPVAEAWNPVRVVLRDVGAGAFQMTVDQGSLLEGEVPWTVTVPFDGGGGVRVVELDVYLPLWRSLRWTVDAGGLRLASGALARTDADRRPVDLVVSARPGDLAGALGGRTVDVAATDLPLRAAAYGGVRSIWLDGTAPLPPLPALAAAAAGGAVVVVQGAARDAPELAGARAAADGGGWATGAGGWWFGPAPAAADLTATRLDVAALATAFAATGGAELPTFAAPVHVALAAFAYLLLVALAWRLGGAVGAVTWAWVVGAATALALVVGRPPAPVQVEARELRLAADGLALAQRAHDVLTFPAGAVAIDAVARPAAALPGGTLLGAVPSSAVRLERWRGATLLEAPRATTAALVWGPDGAPRVVGDAALHDARRKGGGGWSLLTPGAAPAAERDVAPLFGAAAAFEALLPDGSVWAREADAWHVLLPRERLALAEARP